MQEYIRLCVQTGDDKYFYWFLHYFETQLNEKAKFYRNKYKMDEHFADIKQALVCGLCNALVKYDIFKSPFLPYANRYMEREAHSYIRTMRTGYSIQSEFEYARLRKTMAIYKDFGGEFTEETITMVAEQIGESYEKTKSIIEGGILSESYTDIQSSSKTKMKDQQISYCLIPLSIRKTSISSKSFTTSCMKPTIIWNIRRR